MIGERVCVSSDSGQKPDDEVHSTAVDSQHLDLINDVTFDHSGRRMATCSSDQFVSIWQKDPDSGQWLKTHSFHAHSGSVWKVSWANPSFGQVIATCSFDRKACVFEEIHSGDQSGNGTTTWYKRYTFVECHAPVTDVKFGPKREGLLLALASVDGIVRVYEAMSPFKLNMWPSHSIIRAMKSCAISSISWSAPVSLPTLLAVAANGGKEKHERLGIFELCQDRSLTDNQVKDYKWRQLTNPVIDLKDVAVHEVAFAPSAGRCYHMLAVATNEIRIVKIEKSYGVDSFPTGIRYSFSSSSVVQSKGAFDQILIWRLSWNALGTILGASCGDGVIKLWKQNYLHHWVLITSLSPSERPLSYPIPTYGEKVCRNPDMRSSTDHRSKKQSFNAA